MSAAQNGSEVAHPANPHIAGDRSRPIPEFLKPREQPTRP